jgi:hypothetical protein
MYTARQQGPGTNAVFILAAVHCYEIEAHVFLDLKHYPRQSHRP